MSQPKPVLTRDVATRLRQAGAWLGAHRPDAATWAQVSALLGPKLAEAPLAFELDAAFDVHALALGHRLPPAWIAAVIVGEAGVMGAVVLDAGIALSLVNAMLPGGETLLAPRTLTRTERGLVAYAIAAGLEASGIEGACVQSLHDEPASLSASLGEGHLVGVHGRLRVAGATGAVFVLLSEASLRPCRFPRDTTTLPVVHATCELITGGTWLTPEEIAALDEDDIVVLDFHLGRTVMLGASGGAIETTADDNSLTVMARFAEVDVMASHAPIADTLRVPLTCRAGELSLSVQDIAALAPGAVVSLERPIGSEVELVNAGHVVARGHLVDLEGDIGVRLTSVSK